MSSMPLDAAMQDAQQGSNSMLTQTSSWCLPHSTAGRNAAPSGALITGNDGILKQISTLTRKRHHSHYSNSSSIPRT